MHLSAEAKYSKLYIREVNFTYAEPNLSNYLYYFKPYINLELICHYLTYSITQQS